MFETIIIIQNVNYRVIENGIALRELQRRILPRTKTFVSQDERLLKRMVFMLNHKQ